MARIRDQSGPGAELSLELVTAQSEVRAGAQNVARAELSL